MNPRGQARNGFTRVELMIVLAIISIILALAVPSFTDARKLANETRAV